METRIPGGLLVAIEGIDGSGKTTLARALGNALRGFGVPVVCSKEPTNGPHGQALRATAATGRLPAEQELALLVADRAQHVRDLIAPTLDAGGVVILDRYFYSNIAYQGAAGLDPVRVAHENRAIAPEPDLLLLLDLPVPEGLARIGSRGDTANAFERAETLELARGLFRQHLPPGAVVIDAGLPADAVARQALAALVATLARKCHAADGLSVESAANLAGVLGQAVSPFA